MASSTNVFLVSVVLLVVLCSGQQHGAQVEDNDFAEFEELDDELPLQEKRSESAGSQEAVPKVIMAENAGPDIATADDDEATVEDEDDIADFSDPDEFEQNVGYEKSRPMGKGKGPETPDLKITPIPHHLRTNWDSFYIEMLMLAGLGVYFLNFLAGKNKNSRLAQTWLSVHRDLLEANFSIVGDDGQSKEVQSGIMMKESEHMYSLWCSGRVCCEGMLVELKFIKRQDLVSVLAKMLKPTSDQIHIKVTMDEGEMDTFVFCLANKKICSKLQKDTNDLNLFCSEKKSCEKFGLPSSFQLLSEIPEAATAVLDRQVVAALTKFESCLEYMHFSDQYSGPKLQDDSQPSKLPETEKVLIFCFNVPGRGYSNPKDIESMRPLLQMVFHCMDKVRKIRLSREFKQKAERNRQKVADMYLKASHAQRQEAAQARKEEKKREEKEKIMNEDDPDKQRKWEERESRREMKKKQAKMKMMKIKAA